MKTILLLLFNVLLFSSHAAHLAGSFISYRPVGPANTYEITLTIYRKCTGPYYFFAAENVGFYNACTSTGYNLAFPLISQSNVSQYCLRDTTTVPCNGGFSPRYEKGVYMDTVQLPSTCNNWTISNWKNTRTSSINTQYNNVPLYVETTLDNQNYPQNSSTLRAVNYPIPYVCANQSIDLALFVNDPDQDSLVFSLEAGQTTNSNLVYNAPYSGTDPITGISINSQTGQLHFNHSVLGNFVVAVLVEEFSTNGSLIASTKFDFLIIIDNCTNSPPLFSNNVQNFNNSGTGANISNNTISACPGDQFCFDIVVSDSNSLDSLTLSCDIDSLFPGATFVQTGYNPAVASICWSYHPNFESNIFSVAANDNNCPAVNYASVSYLVDLPSPLQLTTDTLYLCDTINDFLLSTNNSQDLYYYDLNGTLLDTGIDVSCNPCNSVSFKFAQDTAIIVSHQQTGNCYAYGTLQIIPSFIPDDFFPDTTIICTGDSLILYSPTPEFSNIWNLSAYQDSLIITAVNPVSLFLQINNNGYCEAVDGTLIIPIADSDLLTDTLIHCGSNQNIAIAPVNTIWYDLTGTMLDIGTDIDCNPCGNPHFLFTSDTMVTKQINEVCPGIDTLYIRPNKSLNNYFSDTIFFCDEDTVQLINPFINYNIIWHTAENSDTIFLQTDSSQIGFLSIYIDTLICDTKDFLLFSQQTEAIISSSVFGLSSSDFVTYQWLYNNANILGASNQNHLPLNNGNYQVFVTDSIGCTDTSAIFIIASADIIENSSTSHIYRVNNNIIINSAPPNSTLELYDLGGKLIERRLINGSNIIVNHPMQIYIAKLISSEGRIIEVKKM